MLINLAILIILISSITLIIIRISWSGRSWFRGCGRPLQAHHGIIFLGDHIGAGALLGEAFFRASFHTRRALNALEVIYFPSASGAIDGNRVGGAFSLAKAAEDAGIDLIINLAAGRRIIVARLRGVWMSGRF